jgi:hypothetical protein
MRLDTAIRTALHRGQVIPACPLALTSGRVFDGRRQRALVRYYAAAGAGGLAVAVHTTQFAIREPQHSLFRPVLEIVADELDRAYLGRTEPMVRVAGVCGDLTQAVAEAKLIRDCGYHVGLLSLAALKTATEDELLAHCQKIAQIIPLCGFYLQAAVGGRSLPYSFWRRFVEIENVAAIKIAPFNRYQTLDVMRAVAESGRDDIALYTGNDDNIIADLLTPHRFQVRGKPVECRMVGGLLGQWAVWTRAAVTLFTECREACGLDHIPASLLRSHVELTDANAAFFDASNGFAGCVAGLHEVLRRQGLLESIACLNPQESLSPGQADEIDRVYRAYPHLNDDEFVRDHLDEWLRA